MKSHKNIIGPQVRKLRQQRGWSLDRLATEFAQQGVFISPQTLERVESRQEFVGSIELFGFAVVFRTDAENLYPSALSPSLVREAVQLLQQNANSAKARRGFIEARAFGEK